MSHSTDQRTTSDGEEFLRLRRLRKASPDRETRVAALAALILLGSTTDNKLVRERVTDFLLSEERVLADFDGAASGARSSVR